MLANFSHKKLTPYAIYVLNARWYVDEMPANLPKNLPIGDSINLLIKVDFDEDQIKNDFIFDTLSIIANETYHYRIIIAINEEFITGNFHNPVSNNNLKVFPNPFSGKTNISFHLDKSSKVSIEILDQQLMFILEVLSNKKLKKGNHLFNWDPMQKKGYKVSPGIYYCRIIINDNPIVIKMVFQ